MNLSRTLTLCKSGSVLLFMVYGAVAMAQVSSADIKLGLWQTETTSSTKMALPPDLEARIAAMPPAQQDMMRSRMGGKPVTTTSKSCVAKQESVDSMLNDAQKRPGMKCTFSNRTPSGFDLSCATPQGRFTGHTEIQQLSGDRASATTHMTGEATGPNGNTMKISVENKMESKYLGSDCGDVKPPVD